MVHFTSLSLLAFAASATAQSTNATIRFMPFGDSITEIVCWRAKLWEKFQSTPYASVNWVGSGRNEAPAGCKDTKYDRDNEGHSGFQATDIANKGQLDGWLTTNPADVITMHLGTNDITARKSTAEMISAFTTLVATMRKHNARMKIVVAQIIPYSIGTYNTQVTALNAAILPWAKGLNTTASPIWVVDQFTGFSASDERDNIHPNDAGDVKMANVWYPAVLRAFEAVTADRRGGMKRWTA